MLFYENLLKEIEKNENKELKLKKIEKFSLNSSRKIGGYGVSIPLIAIGLFQVYSYTVYHKWYFLILGLIFFGIGLKQTKTLLTYSITIDTEILNLKSYKLNILFSNIETATLKEMKLGKKVVPVIDMISSDKKQIIIPLYMNRQLRFILVMKELLKEKFLIEK